MPLDESLHWQPELTKPPAYQIAVRGISKLLGAYGGEKVHQEAPHAVPSEWHLRLPAAVCGALAVAAMWWLGAMAGGWTVGAAGALLFAVNALQIDYSQEARPYSMLVLGSIISTGIWFRLIARQEGSEATRQKDKGVRGEFQTRHISWLAIAYVVTAALTFHANYLMALTVFAHALWAAVCLILIENRQSKIDNFKALVAVLAATAICCVPIVWHFLRYRTSVFQGLDWIAPPTVGTAIGVLGEITFGPIWVVCLLAVAALSLLGYPMAQIENRKSPIENGPRAADERRWTQIFRQSDGRKDLHGLLLVWLVVAWGGLLVISWVAHPAMVARYALPAAAPAILLPLMVLHRLDRRLPLLVGALFFVWTAPVWATRTDRVKPGFREMAQFLDEYADPQREAIVVAIERTTSPGWEEMDLLGFEYYGGKEATRQQGSEAKRERQQGNEATGQRGNGEIETLPHHQITTSPHQAPIEVLYLRNGMPDGDQPILRDPRALWMVTFLADPMEAIESAGRRVEQIEIEDKVFDQLYFEPYRLIRVAATN